MHGNFVHIILLLVAGLGGAAQYISVCLVGPDINKAVSAKMSGVPHRVTAVGRTNGLIYAVYFGVFTAHNIWAQSFAAYAANDFGVGAQQLGFLYSAAGVPGVLTFVIGVLARRVNMAVLLIGACWLSGLGLTWLGGAGEWYELWFGVLGVSAGMACFYPILTSLQLLTRPTQRAGSALGRLKSLGPLSAIVAAVLIHVAEPVSGIRDLLVVVGTSVVLGGTLAGLIIGRGRVVLMHGRLRIKSRLWPYYLLNFLAGCRSALFKSFAIFLLVSTHGFDLQGTALLVVAGSLLTFVGYNVIGHLVDRWGSRTVLCRIYGAVTLIFLGFAFGDSASLLVVLYCLDSLLFGASVVTEAHLRRASVSSHLVGDVAAGLTLFSLASLFMPFVAGNVWNYAGREATFLLGSFTAGMALLASRALVDRGPSIETAGQN